MTWFYAFNWPLSSLSSLVEEMMYPLLHNSGGTVPWSQFIWTNRWVVNSVQANVERAIQMGWHLWHHSITPYICLPTYLTKCNMSISALSSQISGPRLSHDESEYEENVVSTFQLRLQKIHGCNRISGLLHDLLICHPCNWVYLLIPLPNKTSTKSGCSRSWIAHIIYKYSLCSWLIVLSRNHRFSFHIWVPQEAGPLNIPAVLSQVQGTSHVCLGCVYRLVVS